MERLCFDTLQSLKQSPHFRFKCDSDGRLTRRFELIPLPPKPFNHLSVVAYLAIGVVVLASSLVAGYLVYSCYHSARGKGVEQKTTLQNEDNFRDAELGVYEKDEIINDLELRHIEGLPGHDFQRSGDSKCNTRASDIVDSQVFFENESNVAHYDSVNCPQLAHISDRSATFHLPPPPSSPSPAHKQHIQRYAGEISSPVSPSPSFFPDDPPSAVLTTISSLEGNFPNPERQPVDATRKQQVRVPQFDLKNIRYIPPLDTFVPESKRHKESKLLPVKYSTTTFVSPGDDHTRPSQGLPRSTTTPTRPGLTEMADAPGRRFVRAEIDTGNIKNQSPYKNRWENVPPGFF